MKILFFFCFLLFGSVLADTACSAKFSSACAARNAMNLAIKAQKALAAAATPTQLINLWHEITYGNTFRIPGGFYVFVYDWADHNKAHGGNPMNVGNELKDIIKRNGFVSTINLGPVLRAAANISGGSWARYEWAQTIRDYTQPRKAWVMKFNRFRTDYYVGAGYIDIDEDWVGMPCHQIRSSFCAVESAVNLAEAVSRDLRAACNGMEVEAILDYVNNGSRYRLIDGFYTTVTLLTGKQVANGYNDKFVGLTIQQIAQQLRTFDYIPANLHDQFGFAAFNHSSAWVVHPWTNTFAGSAVETYTYSICGTSVDIDYYVTSGYQNVVDPLCPHCNCIPCRDPPVCEPCPEPPEQVVTQINFKFKGLTCAGDKC